MKPFLFLNQETSVLINVKKTVRLVKTYIPNSSDASKTSSSVTRLSSYLYRDTVTNIKVRIENTKLPSERFQLGWPSWQSGHWPVSANLLAKSTFNSRKTHIWRTSAIDYYYHYIIYSHYLYYSYLLLDKSTFNKRKTHLEDLWHSKLLSLSQWL